MPGFFSRLKGKDGPQKPSKSKKNASQAPVEQVAAKPKWEDAWLRKTVDPEEVQELLHGCTLELKSRGANKQQIMQTSFSCIWSWIYMVVLHRLT
jgi:hypothetical protein